MKMEWLYRNKREDAHGEKRKKSEGLKSRVSTGHDTQRLTPHIDMTSLPVGDPGLTL